ncbi:DUF5665 domain-containing protein [Paramaledivibacter caminithermalis]|uniref:Uncharacterized protein n=1 Tax=Paramaledivibacter caminithermalis (strain DSM 15212 / CIP 107654 / DViRD3) TaxID=1121301 RepID=A0A1M6NGD7_PARC5|nr:DUF5665 domain-containing protein [Paramaledivibacter caminithermalis]SHJ94780.1 hypothetical protein SAMN02745912_01706 [Paramaledivibacter caminithermalis DSM 15212]
MTDKRKDSLENKLENISITLEKTKISEYTEIINNPKRLLMVNFIGGLARGFGMAIGFTLLAAVLIYVIKQMVNLPLIGKYIAELINIIENYR